MGHLSMRELRGMGDLIPSTKVLGITSREMIAPWTFVTDPQAAKADAKKIQAQASLATAQGNAAAQASAATLAAQQATQKALSDALSVLNGKISSIRGLSDQIDQAIQREADAYAAAPWLDAGYAQNAVQAKAARDTVMVGAAQTWASPGTDPTAIAVTTQSLGSAEYALQQVLAGLNHDLDSIASDQQAAQARVQQAAAAARKNAADRAKADQDAAFQAAYQQQADAAALQSRLAQQSQSLSDLQGQIALERSGLLSDRLRLQQLQTMRSSLAARAR